MGRTRSNSLRSTTSNSSPLVLLPPSSSPSSSTSVAAYSPLSAPKPLSSHSHADDEVGAFSMADLSACTLGLAQDPSFRLAQTVLSRTSMGGVLDQRGVLEGDVMVFSHRISEEGTPVTNQMRSGRCWLFALLNVLRLSVSKTHKISGSFQLSQSYLYFYDHLMKANWFLEQMIDLVDEPMDSRTMQYLLAGSEAQDGGAYDMAVSLILTFGLVPQQIYPESWNSSHSKELDTFLASKLREYGLELRRSLREGRRTLKRRTALRGARELKLVQMKEVYRILATCCGTPPRPDEKFTWEFLDSSSVYHSITTTPLEFAHLHVGYDVAATMALVHDPRHPFEKVYTVQRLGNVMGGREVRYLNLEVERLKEVAVKLIKDDMAVWFGCDVDKASNLKRGVMDTKLYNYSDAFGTSLTLTKRERLETGDSAMTHAMIFTAVHLDSVTGKPVRWRVENSWGEEACNKGFLVMSDEWFTNYVFQIATPRSHVSARLRKIYDTAEVVELPPWDPLGALA